MLNIQIIFIAVFLYSIAISAQQSGPYSAKEGGIGATQNPNSKTVVSPAKETNSTKAQSQTIQALEKDIVQKLVDLEKLQYQASEYRDFSKEMFLINEKSTSAVGPEGMLTAKYVEYTFEAGKTKEVRVVHRKKNLKNDLHSITRTLTYTPGNSESIKIIVDKFDTRVLGTSEVEAYKNLTTEAKLQALKAIDSALFSTIFRLDTYIQRNELSKIEKNRNQLEGL